MKGVTWIDTSGVKMREESWKDETTRCFGMMIEGRAQPTGIRQKGSDATVLIVLNPHYDTMTPQRLRFRHAARCAKLVTSTK